MSDGSKCQISRRQLLTFGLAVAGGVVALGPRADEAGDPEEAKDRSDVARWAFLSDTHVAKDPGHRFRGFYPHRNLRAVVAQIGSDLPDGLVITGDISRSRGGAEAYGNVKSLLAPIAGKRPIYLGVGNHDNRDDFRRAFGSSGAGGEAVEDKHVVTALAGPVRMIVLDTLLYVNTFPGSLGREQRSWLETYLHVCDDTPTILFLHHAPRADLLDTRRLFEIIAPCRKVKAVVCGHSHKYEFCESDGIQLINLPAVGYNFTGAQPVGWVEARLTGQGGEFVLHAVGGNPRRDGRTTTVRWRA
jgi:3',5'-cyclic AMP phosphodiesterase CpdA